MSAVLERLYAERAELLSTIDEMTDAAEADARDLSNAEMQVITRHQSRIGDELDPQIETLEAVATTRAEHNRAVLRLGAERGSPVQPRASRDPLRLGLDDETVTVMHRALAEGTPVKRALSASDLGALEPVTANARGRLATYTTVREARSPSAAYLAVSTLTPAAPVAEAGPKPKVANASLVSATHKKLAGYVELTREQIAFGVDVGQAVEDVAFRQLITAENVEIVAALAGATAVAAATTPAGSVLAGIASVAAGGGVPSVVALSPADIPAVLGQSSTAGYAVNSGGGAETLASSLWGVPVVAANGVAAGTSYVWDQSAVTASVVSPASLFVDPYSDSLNNVVHVFVEEIVAFVLTQPGAAAVVDLVAP